tara:strand:- start:574 stop:1233 length:660 start_codon:yes stop_codon:yes gene_type:complete
MTQPWEFMGYQKLSTDTGYVSFNNLWDATSPAPKYNNMKFKMVAELLITDTSDLLPFSNGVYYNITADGTANYWDVAYYQKYDTNASNGSAVNWQSGTTANGNSLNGFAVTQYPWIVNYGDTNYQRRYSSAEDNLQWATYEINWSSQYQVGEAMQLKGFNTMSRTNSNAMYNHVIASAGTGSTKITGGTTSSMHFQATYYSWKAGSKFWVWAMRDSNSF